MVNDKKAKLTQQMIIIINKTHYIQDEFQMFFQLLLKKNIINFSFNSKQQTEKFNFKFFLIAVKICFNNAGDKLPYVVCAKDS